MLLIYFLYIFFNLDRLDRIFKTIILSLIRSSNGEQEKKNTNGEKKWTHLSIWKRYYNS